MAAMIAKDDLLFVTGANVDDDHPHGDIDRIDYALGRKGEREDIAVLAGVDIVYLLECYNLRNLINGADPKYNIKTFYHYLHDGNIKSIVEVFNALWSNEWICANNNWEDVYNWESHGVGWSTAFHVAFSERFWSANSRYSVDLGWEGTKRPLLTTDKLIRLYNGLLYYKVFRRGFHATPPDWAFSVSVDNINGGLLVSGEVVEPNKAQYEGGWKLYVEHALARWYPDEQKWRGYHIHGSASNSTALTIDLTAQFSEEVLKCISKVKIAYYVYANAWYGGDFGDGKGTVGTSNSTCSWVTGSTWYEPSADGTLTVYPWKDTVLRSNASVPGMDHNIWPTGAPTNASSTTDCEVHKQYSINYSYDTGMVMLCRLKDEYCYSG